MLLENNTDLSKSPAVGISVPMRAALKKTRWLHLLLTRFLLKCLSLGLFLCDISSQQTQVSLGSAFIGMKCYPCQIYWFLKFPH